MNKELRNFDDLTERQEKIRRLLGDDQYVMGRQVWRRCLRAYNTIRRSHRLLSAPMRALPDFLIIGESKCGTTALYNYLADHPQICPSTKKEIEYFTFSFSRSENWYRSFFPLSRKLARRDSLTFEASTNYLFHPLAAERIARWLPNIKLIAVIRNPVDRAISQYWQNIRYEQEELSMREAFAQEEERLEEGRRRVMNGGYSYKYRRYSYLQRGLYADHLKRCEKYFDRDQILVIKSEDMFQDEQAVFDKAIDFLNLPSHQLQTRRAFGTGSYDKDDTDAKIRKELKRYFEPKNERLYEHLDLDSPWW